MNNITYKIPIYNWSSEHICFAICKDECCYYINNDFQIARAQGANPIKSIVITLLNISDETLERCRRRMLCQMKTDGIPPEKINFFIYKNINKKMLIGCV